MDVQQREEAQVRAVGGLLMVSCQGGAQAGASPGGTACHQNDLRNNLGSGSLAPIPDFLYHRTLGIAQTVGCQQVPRVSFLSPLITLTRLQKRKTCGGRPRDSVKGMT